MLGVSLLSFLDTHSGAIGAVAAVLVALFMIALTVVTNRQVSVGKLTAEAARAAATLALTQQRAYVHVSAATISFPAPGGPVVALTIRNFGQTPAYDVSWWSAIWIAPYPLREALPEPGAEFRMSVHALPPGGIAEMRIPKRPPVARDVEHLLGAPEGTIYAYGAIRYTDAHGVKRLTRFRLMHGGPEVALPGRLQPDAEGNEAT